MYIKKNATATLTSGTAFVTLPGATPSLILVQSDLLLYSSSGSLGDLTDNERIVLQKKESSFLSEYWPKS